MVLLVIFKPHSLGPIRPLGPTLTSYNIIYSKVDTEAIHINHPGSSETQIKYVLVLIRDSKRTLLNSFVDHVQLVSLVRGSNLSLPILVTELTYRTCLSDQTYRNQRFCLVSNFTNNFKDADKHKDQSKQPSGTSVAAPQILAQNR